MTADIIQDPLSRALYETVCEHFGSAEEIDDLKLATAAASLLSGALTYMEHRAKIELIEGIYRALKTEHGIA